MVDRFLLKISGNSNYNPHCGKIRSDLRMHIRPQFNRSVYFHKQFHSFFKFDVDDFQQSLFKTSNYQPY